MNNATKDALLFLLRLERESMCILALDDDTWVFWNKDSGEIFNMSRAQVRAYVLSTIYDSTGEDRVAWAPNADALLTAYAPMAHDLYAGVIELRVVS